MKMKLIVNISIIVVLFSFNSCKNEIGFEAEGSSCDVHISNLRMDIKTMNQYGTGSGGGVYPSGNITYYYFDYYGDCLDSNAYFMINLENYQIDDISNEYVLSNTNSIKYTGSSIKYIDGKIRLGIISQFNNSELFKVSVQGFYTGYDAQTGLLQKETNIITTVHEKFDEMQ